MESLYDKQAVPVTGWVREEQFRFFSAFTQPFFNVHTEVELTPLYHYCKAQQLSVFQAYLYVSLKAARAVENFRLRIEENQVVCYSGLDTSTTVLKNDNTFSFVHLPYQDTLQEFCRVATEIIAAAKVSTQMMHGHQGPDLLHVTTLPWFKFNGIQHASSTTFTDSVPKLAFGKLEFKAEKIMLPMSVSVHHGLADGYHIHLFLKEMEREISAYA